VQVTEEFNNAFETETSSTMAGCSILEGSNVLLDGAWGNSLGSSTLGK